LNPCGPPKTPPCPLFLGFAPGPPRRVAKNRHRQPVFFFPFSPPCRPLFFQKGGTKSRCKPRPPWRRREKCREHRHPRNLTVIVIARSDFNPPVVRKGWQKARKPVPPTNIAKAHSVLMWANVGLTLPFVAPTLIRWHLFEKNRNLKMVRRTQTLPPSTRPLPTLKFRPPPS